MESYIYIYTYKYHTVEGSEIKPPGDAKKTFLKPVENHWGISTTVPSTGELSLPDFNFWLPSTACGAFNHLSLRASHHFRSGDISVYLEAVNVLYFGG